jgi:hypothetical protein
VQKNDKPKQLAYHGSSPDEIAICKKAKEIGVEFISSDNGRMKVNFMGTEQSWQLILVTFFPDFFKTLLEL